METTVGGIAGAEARPTRESAPVPR